MFMYIYKIYKTQNKIIYADILPAGRILCSTVNFSYLYHLIKGMRPKICGN